MNQEVSTVDPNLTPEIPWSESLARTDINLSTVSPTSKNPEFTWTAFSELDIDKNALKRYLDYKTASLHGPFFFPWNFVFPKQNIFSDLIEHSTYGDKKIRIYQVELDNSTTRQEQIGDLNEKVENFFELANEEEFEDGIESDFSRKLISFIMENGSKSVEVLAPIFVNEKANAEIISEALRWIGRIDQPETENIRLWLLERCLFCTSPSVRDGATLGLASMNASSAKYSLRKAIEKEYIKELHEDMKEVLSELETHEDAVASEENQKK